ncbi:MAG: hypothetical protein U5K29_02975 [Acidimicrobiales bacterium]|nr:hypothetical protein [Acidimicrobiales bacterium]
MDGHCDKHVFEAKDATCRNCGGDFCADCLVYAHGPKKPPLCVNCALTAAGIRSTAARPVVRTKREIKREEKAKKRAEKLAAKARSSVATDALYDARPVSDSPNTGAPGGPGVEFEFTINDDGSIERPAERQAS